jgi:hypothetical protein
MKSFETISASPEIPESAEAEMTPEKELEIEERKFVKNFSKLSEQVTELASVDIQQPFSEKLRRIGGEIQNFFKENDYENAKLIRYGLAIVLGKVAVRFFTTMDMNHDIGLDANFKEVLEIALNPERIGEYVGIGAGSAIGQKMLYELKRGWPTEIKPTVDIVKENAKAFFEKINPWTTQPAQTT